MAETTQGPGEGQSQQGSVPGTASGAAADALAEKLEAARATEERQERAFTSSGIPSSSFWAFHDFTAAGRFLQHIPLTNPSVIVNNASQIAVSITELDSSGRPFIGDAVMEVFNVAPNDDNTLVVRGHVHFDHALSVRLNMVILN
jgi:hypothetical protein